MIFLNTYAIHNIIQVHNNVLWDLQYSTSYSQHSDQVWEYPQILPRIMSVPQKIVMNMNDVMTLTLIRVTHIEGGL
jgi:hypothetical protein